MTSAAGTPLGPAAAVQVIACSASRCITARERRRALQGRGHAGADGARPGSFVVLYRTRQPDIAVQDTERWTVNTVDNSERPMVGESSCALWPFRGGWRDD